VLTEDEQGKATGRMTGIGPHALSTWTGTFASISVGDETIRNFELLIADLDRYLKFEVTGSRIPVSRSEDMYIGADFFMSHRLIVAGDDRKILFTYSGGPVFQTMHSD